MPIAVMRWPLGVLLLLVCSLASALTEVTVVTVGDIAFFPERKAPANVVSLNDSRLSAQVSARLVSIPVRVGEVLKAGTVVARLDERDFQVALRNAQALMRSLQVKHDLAKVQLERAQSMEKNKSVSLELLDQRKSQLEDVAAQIEGQKGVIDAARIDLGRCELRTPFRALVVERLAGVGELASPGTPLIRIQDIDSLELVAAVQLRDIASLRNAETPVFVYDGLKVPVKIRTVVKRVNPKERTREVRLVFVREAALSGTPGELVWSSRRPNLPADLLVRRKGELGIFTVDGDQARFVVLSGAQEGRPVEVDLPADTVIVRDGRHNLTDGQIVTVR